MIQTLLAKVIGTQNERDLKRLYPRVAEISALEPEIKALSDEQLRAKTVEFRQRFVLVRVVETTYFRIAFIGSPNGSPSGIGSKAAP